ncbi:MAG TPA: hypothetical protein VJ751_13265 [Pyrinomonadaceae bacterium]|nr:hypothetical protein [Pyrinomonadaceae bacterium]
MTRSRVLTSIISAVFCLTLVSSARADSARHVDMLLEKLIFAERHNLTIIDAQRADTDYLYAAHFENNNGKHLGFGMAVHQGPRLGIVRPSTPAAEVTQNPEPTAMVLLGTGLAAAAALARKINRKRRTDI